MVNDNERRQVARRLRELDYADLQESLICAYLDALGIEGYEDWVGISHHLADLIEPSCDREALLQLADKLNCSATKLLKTNDLDSNRKRRSMRREHAQNLMAASSCIRRALNMGGD